MAGLFAGDVVAITDEGIGIAQALAQRLKMRGMDARVVTQVSGAPSAVIFLGGLAAAADDGSALALLSEAFLAAKSACANAEGTATLFVTVQDTGGDFGLSGSHASHPWLGGLAGLAKTAALEWPHASVKAIDIERGQRTAEQLAQALEHELVRGGIEPEVGLHADGSRIVLQSYRCDLPADRPAAGIDSRSVFVVSGGARGVTAAAVIGLAQRTRARFLLLGRTALVAAPAFCDAIDDENGLKRALAQHAAAAGQRVAPLELSRQVRDVLAVREIENTLRALRDAGSEAVYCDVDVCDAEALNGALSQARDRWGAITGIVHGAGVLADKLIADKTPEQVGRVLATKLVGLSALLSATVADPLTHIALFSSVAARRGNPGQCDYAMANEALNKSASVEWRRRSGTCLVKSFNWGPWEGGMVTPALRTRFQAMGIPLIPMQQGTRMFVEELLGGASAQVEVLIGGNPDQGLARSEATFHLLIDAHSHPYLESHRVRGTLVLPMVLAIEWCTRAAQASWPGSMPAACRELKVLRGVTLGRLDAGHRLVIHCRLSQREGLRVAQCELRRADDPRPGYACTIELVPQDVPRGRHASIEVANGATPWPCTTTEAYRDMLFHGPDFHVLRSLDDYDVRGGSAWVATTTQMGWPGGLWSTDPAALDGGLQLTLLWGEIKRGRKSLPMGIGACVFYERGPVDGPVRCLLREKRLDDNAGCFAIQWISAGGRALAEFDDVQTNFYS